MGKDASSSGVWPFAWSVGGEKGARCVKLANVESMSGEEDEVVLAIAGSKSSLRISLMTLNYAVNCSIRERYIPFKDNCPSSCASMSSGDLVRYDSGS